MCACGYVEMAGISGSDQQPASDSDRALTRPSSNPDFGFECWSLQRRQGFFKEVWQNFAVGLKILTDFRTLDKVNNNLSSLEAKSIQSVSALVMSLHT